MKAPVAWRAAIIEIIIIIFPPVLAEKKFVSLERALFFA